MRCTGPARTGLEKPTDRLRNSHVTNSTTDLPSCRMDLQYVAATIAPLCKESKDCMKECRRISAVSMCATKREKVRANRDATKI